MQKIDKKLRKMGKLNNKESLSDYPNTELRNRLIETLKKGGYKVDYRP